MHLHTFEGYLRGISLHLLKKKELKENRGKTLLLSTLLCSMSMPQWDQSSECYRPKQG